MRDQEIIVHRQRFAPRARDVDIGQAETPEIVFLRRPGIGFRVTVGVIAKAPGIHGRVESRTCREIRRAKTGDLAQRKTESSILRQSVIRGDIAEGLIETLELALPIGSGPVPPVEMPDRMRGDVVAARMRVIDEKDAASHIVKRAAEIDARGATPLMRRLVDRFVAVGDEIHTGDKEGEMNAIAVAIHMRGEIRPFLPAIELGAIVKGDGDILRRAIHGESRSRSERQNECERNSEKTHGDTRKQRFRSLAVRCRAVG